ncbi:MAG TPA: hypothetical protein VFA59_24980 [Vicinamibacterales bacterium]|nr:hypothetical protein [Vicinamibacterales bacterium]
MGIVRSNAAFYLDAHARGVRFDRTLTLGRQRLYVSPAELADLACRHRPEARDRAAAMAFGDHADDFLKTFLDVATLDTLDHSTYEGATIAHDLNQPLPGSRHEQYDAVIDSGTLEHVFNVPVALASYMQLLKRGGSLFLSTPANNMCGHGFYQFSPELFFRVFSRANGFALTKMVLVTHPFPGAELSARQIAYDVSDPEELGARAPLMTSTPAFLMIEARRESIAPIFATPPLQSDYVTKWSGTRVPAARGGLRSIFKQLPLATQHFAIGWYQRAYQCTLRNRRRFRRRTD